MKGTDHPHPSHVIAAKSEEAAARQIHAMKDEVVLQWGKPMGANGPDIASYNYETKKLTLWDDKYRSRRTKIKPSNTFKKNSEALKKSIAETHQVVNASTLSSADKTAAIRSLDAKIYGTQTFPSGNAWK
jgi:hypothetical protein